MVWRGRVRAELLLAGLTWLILLVGASEAAATDNVTYNGGPVAHSMSGVVVDWGSSINPMYTDATAGDPGLIKYLAAQSGSTSDIGGVLAQYMDSGGGNAANRANFGGQYAITPSTTATTVYDSQIQTELVNQIQAANLPHPAGNGLSTIYLVLFPSSDVECYAATQCSANAPNPADQVFCAYHSNTYLPDGTAVIYAVLPDDTTGNMSTECGSASTVFQDQTSYLSHEWSETISDPLGDAWWDSSPASADYGNEIGDDCNAEMTSEGGWTVQLEWSNRDRNCVGGESTYNAPAASFIAPSVAVPGQSVSFDASSSSDPSQDTTAISGTSYAIGSGIAHYTWNWGDGSNTSTSSPTATHVYPSLGNYQVSLTVTDNLGFTSTLTKTVSVAATGIPIAATAAAVGVSDTAATLEGTINPENESVQYRFDYGTSPGSLTRSTPVTAGPAGAATTGVSATLSGLTASATYYYQLEVLDGGQSYMGGIRSFTTRAGPPPPQTPTVSLSAASDVSSQTAILAGTINPGGSQPVSYRFAYGTAPTNLGATTPQSSGLSGTSAVAVSEILTGLQSHTTYYFRLDVTFGTQVYSSPVGSFTTRGVAPQVSTGPATSVGGDTATVSGTLSANGIPTSYHVEFGPTAAYGHSTGSVSAPATASNLGVSVSLSGLHAHTLYHYRLVATSAGGTSIGGDRTFATTAPPPPPPRFSFTLPRRMAMRVALRGGLRVRFRCSRGCTAHFIATLATGHTGRFTPVTVTLASGSRRLRTGGPGTATLRLRPGAGARLSGHHPVRLLISGYAAAHGSARTAPKTRRLILS